MPCFRYYQPRCTRTVVFYTVLAQLAERRSPKTDAAGPGPANGAIAEGSAYPAHDRMQTENCVTKPQVYSQKGVFHHEQSEHGRKCKSNRRTFLKNNSQRSE